MPLHERSLAESSARSDAPLMGMAGSAACPHQEGGPVSEGVLPGAAFSTIARPKLLGLSVAPAAACLESPDGWAQLTMLKTLLEHLSSYSQGKD